ncbi:unnamed protein product [Ambrosiozyma monospora]|uniref:Unnamed protein product n=1 Tax=Ambrosiozyma monospora TaxID=43982 RepID=A0ACB5STX5_AMBMO|nr:unnamed protein product [Ambrosiozyma monospora]
MIMKTSQTQQKQKILKQLTYITFTPFFDIEIGESERIYDVIVYLDLCSNLPRLCWLCILGNIDKKEIVKQLSMFQLRKGSYPDYIPEEHGELVEYLIEKLNPKEVHCAFRYREFVPVGPSSLLRDDRISRITNFEIQFHPYMIQVPIQWIKLSMMKRSNKLKCLTFCDKITNWEDKPGLLELLKYTLDGFLEFTDTDIIFYIQGGILFEAVTKLEPRYESRIK